MKRVDMSDKAFEAPLAEIIPELMDNAIKPNAEAIAAIILRGDIALVAYKPDAQWRTAFGVPPGDVHIAVMPGPVRKRMIENGDSVTSRWLRGGRTGRVFVVWGPGTMLVNVDKNGAFSLELGSTDAEAS